MTLPLLKVEDPTLQFNFDEIAKKFLDTGGRQVKVRFGSSTVTWPGGTPNSNQKTVAHGMGSTPVAVFLTSYLATVNTLFRVDAASDATNIYVKGVVSDLVTNPALNTTQSFYWLAIG